MSNVHLTRRAFLRATGLSGLAVLAAQGATPGWPARPAYAAPARSVAHALADPFVADAEVSITAAEKDVSILSGGQTHVWGYEGQLLSGSGVSVTNLPGNYLGPILRVKSGTRIRIYFHNNLAEDSVIHPHGLTVPESCDGHPMSAIGPGQTKIYEFPVMDRAMPAWFHPHPHMRTAEQVAMGLAGLFYVWDDEEKLAVPGAETGANDVPVIIQDRIFDSNNQFLYQPNPMWGYLGNRILVNGKPNAALPLEPRAYRLRFLNGSNARTFKLAWSNGMKLLAIGTDGGLLPAVQKDYIILMPGERVDVWADFSKLAGRQVVLRSLSFSPGMMGGGGGGGGMGSAAIDGSGMDGGGCNGCGGGGGGGGGMGGGLANGAAFDILTVNVGRKATSKPVLGPLPAIVPFRPGDVPNFATPRPFTLDMRMMEWTINGRVFEMMAVADDEMVYANETMAWEWINNTPIPHPMHMHTVQFQVLGRTPPADTTGYDTVKLGFLDSGWKDTVAVWPGERVKVAMTFPMYTGMYMYHCHILEHEDMTMMRNYMIMDPMM